MMLKPLRHCTHCGAEMEVFRSTKTFCSDACRKRAARGIDVERQATSRWIIASLRGLGLISRIWPVYSWDQSPPVFALMVTTQAALDELNISFSEAEVTEGELERALRDCGIETSSAGDSLRDVIKAFYDARKDRGIRKGHTPSDTGNSDP
jgi:predicted nucleic acid-binding Zn ribbon protein